MFAPIYFSRLKFYPFGLNFVECRTSHSNEVPLRHTAGARLDFKWRASWPVKYVPVKLNSCFMLPWNREAWLERNRRAKCTKCFFHSCSKYTLFLRFRRFRRGKITIRMEFRIGYLHFFFALCGFPRLLNSFHYSSCIIFSGMATMVLLWPLTVNSLVLPNLSSMHNFREIS